MKLKTSDNVIITLGKDKSRQGKILAVNLKEHTVLVEGMNMYKRHQKATYGRQAGIIERPRPLDVAKVALVCPKCSKPTRVGFQLNEKTNKKERVCRKCHKVI